MIDGILLVDKEENITSYDVIRRIKKIALKGQKIGHAGTLDPFASGLLVILLGKGTKLMNKFLSFDKEYIVKAEFGYETDTQDRDGKIIEKREIKKIFQKDIEEIIKKKFIGEILQTPPLFSAKKINGRKAYSLAREGKIFELKPKRINIYKFDVISYNWPFAEFKIKCSSGTYIRTLVRDLGRKIGTLATAVELRRTKIGEFNVESADRISDIGEGTFDHVIALDNLSLLKDEG